jgi:regulator of protease activity HflC (stomatin/prohibitin superfamily)
MRRSASSDIVKDGIKNAVAQRTLQQIVSAERAAFTGEMFDRASKLVDDLGIELIDVRVQRIDLPEDVSIACLRFMQQSFERLARQLRGEGEKEALRIRAEADRKRTEIVSAAARCTEVPRRGRHSRDADLCGGLWARIPSSTRSTAACRHTRTRSAVRATSSSCHPTASSSATCAGRGRTLMRRGA